MDHNYYSNNSLSSSVPVVIAPVETGSQQEQMTISVPRFNAGDFKQFTKTTTAKNQHQPHLQHHHQQQKQQQQHQQQQQQYQQRQYQHQHQHQQRQQKQQQQRQLQEIILLDRIGRENFFAGNIKDVNVNKGDTTKGSADTTTATSMMTNTNTNMDMDMDMNMHMNTNRLVAANALIKKNEAVAVAVAAATAAITRTTKSKVAPTTTSTSTGKVPRRGGGGVVGGFHHRADNSVFLPFATHHPVPIITPAVAVAVAAAVSSTGTQATATPNAKRSRDERHDKQQGLNDDILTANVMKRFKITGTELKDAADALVIATMEKQYEELRQYSTKHGHWYVDGSKQ